MFVFAFTEIENICIRIFLNVYNTGCLFPQWQSNATCVEFPTFFLYSLFLSSYQAKCFLLQCSEYDKESGVLTVKVFITDLGLTKLSFPSEGKKMKKMNTAVQDLVSHFYGLPPIKGMYCPQLAQLGTNCLLAFVLCNLM